MSTRGPVTMEQLITTNEAARDLGISRRRVQALITAGRLPSTKVGRDHLISWRDLDQVRDRRPGRPASK